MDIQEALYNEISKMDEITFWSRQFAEHALFLSKGLEGGREELTKLGLEGLIGTGKDLYDIWMGLFKRLQSGQKIPKVIILAHLETLENYKQHIYNLASTTWIGYVFPTEALHYIEELKYVRKHVLAEKMSDEYLLKFWSDINADHAALFAHLLDPSEITKFEASQLYADILKRFRSQEITMTPELNDYITLSEYISIFNDFTSELRELQAKGALESIIHPLLALHIHREGLRAISKLE